ncbi:MAG: amidohydrolase [Ruminococcaceae bacterium]|nr:amidohydrolase [Oscillospiraceae bacterium]
MNPNTILQAARDLHSDILRHRRRLHQYPEIGTHLPQTAAYVAEQLTKLGYAPSQICDSGIVATITGQDTGRCILLRADMDALPISEKTELAFHAENGAMHACGHDMHTAMLLGAAALLRQFRSELQGTVKLVFQPDEEGFTGAKAMLKAGVLEHPTPTAGLALHVHSGTPTGLVLCSSGAFMAGCIAFRITVTGKGCHGAMPETGIDPINIAAHIYMALNAVISREISPKASVSLTVGKFCAGDAPNIIPEKASLEGTLRFFDTALSRKLFSRISQIAQSVASGFQGHASVEEISSVPPLRNSPELVARFAELSRRLLGKQSMTELESGGMGSEDFAVFSQAIPCAYLLLGAGAKEENPLFGQPMHNEKVVFNEDILPLGAALEAYCALEWLKEQAP